MSDNFQLREASNLDFDGLFAIYMDEKVNPFLNFEIMDKNNFKEIFQELLSADRLFVFEKEKTIVASCVVMRQKRRACHVASLGTLATHPQFHGRGIGTQFLQTLFEKLKEEGIKRVDLFVEADNLIAQGFYKKLGFQLEGILKNYFKRPYENHYIDEHIMALLLK
jgi:ribosomal protein S18 acetylase RimI-like enzyme